MLKTLVKWESIIEGKVGHFLLDHDTPISIAKEMTIQFLIYLGNVEAQVKAAQESAALELSKVEEPIEESPKE